MVRHAVLGELTPEKWLVLRMVFVESDMAPEGYFSAADIVRPLNLTGLTEQVVRGLFAILIEHEWMAPPVEAEVRGQQTRMYRLTPLGYERVRALLATA